GKLLRAVYAENQLSEMLTDFWFNHFNVSWTNDRTRPYLVAFERDAIRPNALGSFRRLLGATAHQPAMLLYLDNAQSVAPGGAPTTFGDEMALAQKTQKAKAPAKTPDKKPAKPAAKSAKPSPGINENYARELMELHTLGVDGGYTQQDVTEVARALTGWTIERPRQGGGFVFNPRLHDPGEKVVLGHVIRAGGGESDGEQVLDILARHPATAAFIATKLVRRFVSDAPPKALVARAAARFRQTGGDLREVTRLILTSPEFLSAAAYGAKVKTPFEFVASALRATGADVEDARPLVRELQQLGMPLYMCQPPTGYSDNGEAWVNTGALVSRMNLALRLASGQVKGTVVDAAISVQLNGEVSGTTRATIARATDAPKMIALTLGSPEFQRR
ncbi:MAG: hypothetical protein JWL71_3599, partial [Acidobacteria bacterium]|nr:hypothetical protein [Acidobacteriota bacterium]